MKFEQGELYKHKDNTDVAFYVKGISGGFDNIFLRGVWVNIVNPSNYFMLTTETERITVKLNEQDNWEKIHVTGTIKKENGVG